MKIAYFNIQVLLIVMKTIICLQAKIDQSLYISPNSQISFIETKIKTSNKLSNSNMKSLTGIRIQQKYKSNIIILKEKDSIEDPPVEFEGEVEIAKDNLSIYLNGELKKKISYLE